MPKFYAAIDGGGSKTLAVIVDEAGRERARATAGGSNYQVVGIQAAVQSVQAALSEAARLAEVSLPLEQAALGLSGLDRPADHAIWQAALQNEPFAKAVRLSNDAELILYAHPHGQGLGLISGTGAIAIGRGSDNSTARSSGWGHFFGDEGSGLWFGREALRAAAKMADGRGPDTRLLGDILQHWQLETPGDLIGAVYTVPVNNARVAQLAGLVLQAAQAGDEVATGLVQQAGRELAQAVLAVIAQLKFDELPHLALAGGLLLNFPLLRSALLGHFLDGEALTVVLVSDPALVTAKALAEAIW